MGHRRNRKQDRRAGGTSRDFARNPAPDLDWLGLNDDSGGLFDLAAEIAGLRPAPVKQCGGCREFVEDQEGGRGTCLHPGSGILSPWTDTEACAFYTAQRYARQGG